ncbi:MAG: hypothetical protein ACRC1H_03470 [Caldilineaceae bacterium]
MQFRRLGLVLVALLIVMASLAGCVAGSAVAVPDRELTVDLDTALMAQDMGMAGLMGGTVTWTESEFSSFLTYLVAQNAGASVPLDGIKVWFEPGNMVVIEATPSAGVPLAGPVRLSGMIGVEDNMVMVDVAEASVGDIAVTGPLLDVVSGAVNRALADPSLGVAVDVATDTGEITLSLGM